MNIAAIVAAIAFATGFGAAWQVQGGRITTLKLEQANERISQQRASRATYERYSAAVSKAQNDAQTRRSVISADSRRVGDVGNGLRITSTSAVRTAADNADACASIVAAYDTILEEGRGFIEEVAGAVDQCQSDIKLMQDAWPRY